MIIPIINANLKSFMTRDYVQGVVVQNNDPLNKSRVRVMIQGISDRIDPDFLPWYPLVQDGANSRSKIPPVNTRVIVKYTSIYNSFVVGSFQSITPV